MTQDALTVQTHAEVLLKAQNKQDKKKDILLYCLLMEGQILGDAHANSSLKNSNFFVSADYLVSTSYELLFRFDGLLY